MNTFGQSTNLIYHQMIVQQIMITALINDTLGKTINSIQINLSRVWIGVLYFWETSVHVVYVFISTALFINF